MKLLFKTNNMFRFFKMVALVCLTVEPAIAETLQERLNVHSSTSFPQLDKGASNGSLGRILYVGPAPSDCDFVDVIHTSPIPPDKIDCKDFRNVHFYGALGAKGGYISNNLIGRVASHLFTKGFVIPFSSDWSSDRFEIKQMSDLELSTKRNMIIVSFSGEAILPSLGNKASISLEKLELQIRPKISFVSFTTERTDIRPQVKSIIRLEVAVSALEIDNLSPWVEKQFASLLTNILNNPAEDLPFDGFPINVLNTLSDLAKEVGMTSEFEAIIKDTGVDKLLAFQVAFANTRDSITSFNFDDILTLRITDNGIHILNTSPPFYPSGITSDPEPSGLSKAKVDPNGWFELEDPT